MNRLKNKVAVVTGASKGIGAAIAKHFAAEGAKVGEGPYQILKVATKFRKPLHSSGRKMRSVVFRFSLKVAENQFYGNLLPLWINLKLLLREHKKVDLKKCKI